MVWLAGMALGLPKGSNQKITDHKSYIKKVNASPLVPNVPNVLKWHVNR